MAQGRRQPARIGQILKGAMKRISVSKACEIMRDGEVHGKPLTDKQKGLFGAICGQRRKK